MIGTACSTFWAAAPIRWIVLLAGAVTACTGAVIASIDELFCAGGGLGRLCEGFCGVAVGAGLGFGTEPVPEPGRAP